MKVLVAVDSFKGSMSSIEASEAITAGVMEVFPAAEVIQLPLADGGEGTAEAFVQASNGKWVEKEVQGPLKEKVLASYGISGDEKTAFIEVAAACGLTLLEMDELNPFATTTYGVGELIEDALERGCRHFIIGLGGSATNDAGVGMLQALGFEFLTNEGEAVDFGGGNLSAIHTIRTEGAHPLLKACKIQVACDVNNYLHGENGAAYVFGPQKGASTEDVAVLDQGLRDFSRKVTEQMGKNIHTLAGAGAAGGLGGAFAGFLGASLESGIGLVLEYLELERYLLTADLVVTGEGMLDAQTSMGKAPIGLAEMAKRFGVPVIGLAGAVQREGYNLHEKGMTASFSVLNAPMSLEEAMDAEETYENLKFTTTQLFQLIRAMR